MSDKALLMENLSVRFGSLEVFRQLSLEIGQREFVAVVGPSGCGKTTLLNICSGFLKPSGGRIVCHGRVRMVYQQDSLLPWQTVAENVALGLRGVQNEADRTRQLDEMLLLVRLEEFAEHYPHQLSGGMRQRVELARALIGNSDILLLDEPFSSLDYLARLRMRLELARMLEELPRTVVLVTHDIEEAAQLADRILVLSDRPARICREIRIGVDRPREPTHPEVVDTVHSVLMELGLERGKRSVMAVS